MPGSQRNRFDLGDLIKSKSWGEEKRDLDTVGKDIRAANTNTLEMFR